MMVDEATIERFCCRFALLQVRATHMVVEIENNGLLVADFSVADGQ